MITHPQYGALAELQNSCELDVSKGLPVSVGKTQALLWFAMQYRAIPVRPEDGAPSNQSSSNSNSRLHIPKHEIGNIKDVITTALSQLTSMRSPPAELLTIRTNLHEAIAQCDSLLMRNA